jgi:hypothetical protein
MPQKVTDIVIDEFKGIDTESDPTNLPKEVTNNLQNVYPILNGRAIRKRPGISGALTDVARSGPIYHLLRGAVTTPGIAGGPDVLFMLYGGGTATAVSAASYWIDQDQIEDYGATTHTADDERMASLVLAGIGRVMITNGNVQANDNFIEHFQAVTPFYRLATYASGTPLAAYQVAAWHRQHLWWDKSRDPATVATMVFSAFDNPISYPAANTVDVDPRGKMDATIGMFQMGDALYIGKGRVVFVLTGANDETFAIERTRIPFGFGGMRSWDTLGGGRGIGFIHVPINAKFSSVSERTETDGLGIIEGLDGQPIGDSIRSLTRSAVVGGIQAHAEATALTKNWPEINGTLFITQARFGFASDTTLTAVFRSREDGTFWRWSLESTVGVNALEVAFRTMFAGCHDGHIRRFDSAVAQDSGTNFDNGTYWQSAPLWNGQPHVKWVIPYVRIYGSQTSGGQASVQIATDFGALGTAQVFDLDEDGAELRFNVTEGYFQQVRITIANDSVEGTIRKVVIGALPTGKSA